MSSTMLVCVKITLLCFSATVLPEAFHSPTVVQNSLIERGTITHCSDAMRYGELPALHTTKCVYTVAYMCVCNYTLRWKERVLAV